MCSLSMHMGVSEQNMCAHCVGGVFVTLPAWLGYGLYGLIATILYMNQESSNSAGNLWGFV